jgi:CHASE2 domain-containing sensor protein
VHRFTLLREIIQQNFCNRSRCLVMVFVAPPWHPSFSFYRFPSSGILPQRHTMPLSSALQTLRSRLAGTHRVGEIGALLAIVLAMIFFATPLGRELSYLSYDIPFVFRPQATITNAEIILMDKLSHAELEQSPGSAWHRTLHVQLLRRLKELGADAVVIDVLWEDDWVDEQNLSQLDRQLAKARARYPGFGIPVIPAEQVDAELGNALKAHGKVIVASDLSIHRTSAGDMAAQLISPIDAVATNAVTGIINLKVQEGIFDAIRFHSQDPRFTSMAEATARLLKPGLKLPGEQRWISYYGPAGTITNKSYYQVLQPDGLTSNYFAGKIVFIGKGQVITPEGQTRDDFPTSYNLQGRGNTSGVEIQATACLNYLRGDWLTELSTIRHLMLFIASGIFFGVLFAFVRPWIAVVLAVVGFLAVAFAGIYSVWHTQTHTWFSWLIIGAVQIPTALGWALLINTRRLYRENLALEEALKTATATPPATGSSPDAPTIVAPAHAQTIVARPGAAALPLSSEWLARPGDLVGDHQLVRCVGEGAYGQVWLARNVIGTYAALKLVYRKKFNDDAPFEREFQGLKRFMPISRNHAGFVQILHVGKSEGFFYYVMEPGDDETNRQKIDPDHYSPRNLSGDLQRRGKLPLPECLNLAVNLSAALHHLHENNLIHRDIKPSNIIFVNGQPKIADIGLVTVIATSRTDATYIGTPGYIPPEGPGTAAADVYSLGKVIYEAAMGRHVANYPALPTTLIERDDYKALLELNDLIIKACADNVALRYQSAVGLHDDLVRLQSRLVKHIVR